MYEALRPMNNILITGGTGLVGSHLIPRFEAEGNSVAVLSRSGKQKGVASFKWDPDAGTMDLQALDNVNTIINLAGAGIADKRWTESYKRKILDSRVKSAEVLFHHLKNNRHNVKTIISASAVGYYGDTGDTWVDEDARPIDTFLSTTCVKWENAVRKFETLGIRVVILRIGVILDRKGGALPVMAMPVKMFAGAPLGSGKQYIPWIHMEDLCSMFSFAVKNDKLHGVFNACAPSPVPNAFFIKQIGKVLQRPVWPIAVPSFILRLILGEKADIVINGQRTSSEKIRMAGFRFKHVDLISSIAGLLK